MMNDATRKRHWEVRGSNLTLNNGLLSRKKTGQAVPTNDGTRANQQIATFAMAFDNAQAPTLRMRLVVVMMVTKKTNRILTK